MNVFQEFGVWPSKPGVRWFHFWNPHSGLVGGIISACVIIGLLTAVVFSLSSCAHQPPGAGIYKALQYTTPQGE